MTRLELLEFDLSATTKPRGISRKRILTVGALALLLLGLQLGGVLGKQFPVAYGALWQDFFAKPLSSEARRVVQFGISYKQGEGVAFHVFEDTPVRVQVDGGTVVTRAPFPRLESILQDAGVELGGKDRAEAKIVTGEGNIPEINVVRVRNRIVGEEEPIPFPVRRVGDLHLAPGETRVLSPGRPGVLLKKFEVTTENGQEVARKELGSEVIKKPVPRIIAYGARTTPEVRQTASRDDGPGGNARRVIRVVATAYTHTGNPTATGVMPYVGGVAVDPDVIPLGSRLYIEGYGPARAVDTGGLIKGNRIDLFFDSAAECYKWGKREVNVYVME